MRKYKVPWSDYFLLSVNPAIRFMILSDFVWMGAVGLIVPIFALLVDDFIPGSTAATVGFAASIYLITKSVVQIFAASVIDWIRGEKDDFWILFIFSFIGAVLPLAYLFMTTPAHLYLIQFLYGVCIAFTFPSFMALFTRHLDTRKEGTEWGVYYTINDLGSAFTAFAGGVIATVIGFKMLIFISVGVSVAGVLFLYPIRYYLYK
ncbi:MAG: MFS transporter [Parcubacteria group bacterium]|nr:MFS transporter [Parcubacteria group bacterium]MBI3074789.1 MFS transporter [Parcubacteria group bacterium]